jgi:hypothetical protein
MLQLLYPKERTPVPLEYKAVWDPKLAWVFWRRGILYMQYRNSMEQDVDLLTSTYFVHSKAGPEGSLNSAQTCR